MINNMIFLMVLFAAAWQDYRTRSIGRRFLWVSACVGGIFCVFRQAFSKDIFVSCGIGIVLLGLGRVTDGAIGEGDGWFFVVTGMYLSWVENLQLFLSGLCFCFVWSLPLAVSSIVKKGRGRNRELPFLPFLLPAGIWLAVT